MEIRVNKKQIPAAPRIKIDREDILGVIRLRGPCVPSDIAKAMKVDNLIASAYLSDLKSTDHVKMSSLKFGGSPLYYLSGQENQLENFVDELNKKDREALVKLKQEKLIEDKNLDLLTRVSLRKIKDFAVPININNVLYWRWYSLTNEEVSNIIRARQPKKILIEEKIISKPEIILEKKLEQKKVETKLSGNENVQKIKKLEKTQEKKIQAKMPVTLPSILDNFFEKVKSSLNLEMNDIKIISKNKEFEGIVLLPTKLGNMKCCFRAINKKSINEKDLSAAYVSGLKKNLPVAILTSGELTKKAKEAMGEFTGMMIYKI